MGDSLPAAKTFLTQYWQKKPLLARGVLTQFADKLDRARLCELAGRDDVESRLVVRVRNRWNVRNGPFTKRDFRQLPPRGWTLLVNGLETVLPAARALQQAFSFIPYARHDDVMASYAAPGGSVGPHFDSYDVCLVQGMGARRWMLSAQRELALVADAPLKLLRRFRAQREWTASPGDLIYLPPRYAHHGVALGECITWSVGFRAPSRRDMIERFLDYLRDRERPDALYRDPWLRPQRHAGAIGGRMLQEVGTMLASLRWNDADIERCLGEYLSEPRATVRFTRPRALAAARFDRLLAARGARLALASRLLVSGSSFFINGESIDAHKAAPAQRDRALLRRFADTRELKAGARPARATLGLLYEWYLAGYIELGKKI